MAKMNSNQTSMCWRGCNENIATHLNIFWQCPLLANFWKSIFVTEQSTRSWSGKKPSDSYSWDEPDITFNRKRMYILQIILIAAKKAITLRWLKQDPPTNAEWVAILRNIFTQWKKITYMLWLQKEAFIERWLLWMSEYSIVCICIC